MDGWESGWHSTQQQTVDTLWLAHVSFLLCIGGSTGHLPPSVWSWLRAGRHPIELHPSIDIGVTQGFLGRAGRSFEP